MTRVREFVPYDYDFSGGLNATADEESVEDNQLVELKNFDFINGTLVKRKGIETRYSASPNVFWTLLGQFQNTNSRSEILAIPRLSSFVNTSGAVWRSSDGGTTWTECVFAGPSSAFIRSWLGVQYGSAFYIPNDGPNLIAWNGTNLTNIPGAPDGYEGLGGVVQDRLFIWNPTSKLLAFSDLGNFTGWPAANSILMESEADQIACVVPYKDRIVVFTDNKIKVLYLTGTPVNWQYKELTRGIGATGHFSFVVAEDWIYFIGKEGVYRTNLSTIEEISTPLRNLFKTRVSPGLYNTTVMTDGLLDSIGYYNGRIMCSINFGNTGTGADKRLHRWFVYHLESQIWTEWLPNVPSTHANNFCPPRNFLTIRSHRGAVINPEDRELTGLFFGAWEATGKIFKWSDSETLLTDDGNHFNCSFKTKRMRFGSFSELTKVSSMILKGLFGAQIRVDTTQLPNNLSTTTQRTNLSTGVKGTFRLPGPGYCRDLSYKIEFVPVTPYTNVQVTVYGLSALVRQPRPVVTQYPA